MILNNAYNKSTAIHMDSCFYMLERVMGIEPTWLAWKARALPLSYTRLLKYII